MQNDLKNENPVLDGIDRRLVEMLSANARTTTADLARQVGMSAPSVADRLRRLEDSGVIRAYTVDVTRSRWATRWKPSSASAPCRASCGTWKG